MKILCRNTLKQTAGMMLVAMLACISAQSVQAAICRINGNDRQQMIDGFGFSSAWSGKLSAAKNSALYDSLGMSLLRVRISQNKDWDSEIANSAAAHAAGAKVFGSPWSPPIIWNSNGKYEGGYLLPTHYGDYVDWLNSAASSMGLDYVSIQNEPDNGGAWCHWTPEQIHTFIRDYGSKITKPVIMPEAVGFNDEISDPTINDPEALKNFAILGGHIYTPRGPYIHTNALEHGKRVWMTEHYISNTRFNMTNCIAIAKEMNDCMNSQMSAYVWWWVAEYDTSINLVSNDGAIFKNGYTIGQFAKWVRPGKQRIGSTYEPTPGVYVTAYRNNGWVIVAVNTSNSAVDQEFALSGDGVPTRFQAFRTSATENMAYSGMNNVLGESFTNRLPPQSVTTFVQDERTYYKINATSSPGGSIAQVPAGSSMANGTKVSFTAIPNAGWKFSGWSGAPAGTKEVYAISSLSSDVTLNASFEPVNPYLYEAENAYKMLDAVVAKSHSGYTGEGYVDYGGANSYIELPVYAVDSGEHVVTVNYANGGTIHRGISVAVNGTIVVNPLNCPVTGSWGKWAALDINLDFKPGINLLKLTTVTDGGPSIDKIEIKKKVFYTVKALALPGGSISRNPEDTSLVEGTKLSFIAVPDTGWKLEGWSGDYTGTGDSLTIDSLSSNVTLKASFLPLNPKLYEAEYGRMLDVASSNSHPGFSGKGYADFGGSGSSMDLPVYVPDSGKKVITIAYANGGAVDRPVSLAVDETEMATPISFPSTGAWNTWEKVKIILNLKQGIHVLKLTSVTEGGPNIDKVEIGQLTFYAVNASAFPGGTISQNPAGALLAEDAKVSFIAIPDTGWKFAGWSGNFTGTKDTFTISSLDTIVTLKASFEPINPNLYEAEYARMQDAAASSSNPGYSGTGYAKLSGIGSSIEFPVYASDSGANVFAITYANGGSVNAGISIRVNGTEVKGLLNCPATGGWDKWGAVSVGMNLVKGINVIKLTSVSEADGLNIDKFTKENPLAIDGVREMAVGVKFIHANFTIQAYKPGADLKIAVYSIHGEVMFSRKMRLGSSPVVLELPVYLFSRGTYLLHTSLDEIHEVSKLQLIR